MKALMKASSSYDVFGRSFNTELNFAALNLEIAQIYRD